MQQARHRPAALIAAALMLLALTGCDSTGDTNTAVLTVNDVRARYLDATCPLRADEGFWQRVDPAEARAEAAEQLAIADSAITAVARPPRPWPRLLRPSMTRLTAVLQRNRAYFAAVQDAPDRAAVEALDPPAAVPDDLLAEVESRVTISSASGSPSCTGHLPTDAPSAIPVTPASSATPAG